MAQNFIPKTSTFLNSITNGISRIYQLERKLWLSEVLQKFNHIFIHPLISENDKNVLLIVCDFYTKWGERDTLNFFTVFSSLGTTKLSRSLRLCLYQCCPSDKLSRTI